MWRVFPEPLQLLLQTGSSLSCHLRAHCARALRCGVWLLTGCWPIYLFMSPGIQFSLTIRLVSWKQGSAKMLQICGYLFLAVCLLYPSLVYGEWGRRKGRFYDVFSLQPRYASELSLTSSTTLQGDCAL